MTSLEQAILRVIAFFDVFDYPLTAWEAWKWLYYPDGAPQDVSVEFDSVRTALIESPVLQDRLEHADGMFFLKGRDTIVQTRGHRYRLAEHKYARALKYVRWMRWLPFVRMIGICNTLAYSNSRRDSDIDLFIITARNRVWQARFWVTGFLRLLNARPRPGKTRDTFCASFFVDTDACDLAPLSLPQDIYLDYWIAQVVPVYDEGVYDDFVSKNANALSRIPNVLPVYPTARRRVPAWICCKRLGEWVYRFFPEAWFRRYQQNILPGSLRKMVNQDSCVVMNEHVLKFHHDDRRADYYQAWHGRLQTLL